MKSKKILSGLVVVAVLLSGTALARPGGGICDVGFCARQKDRVPGCTTVPCCPTGEPYCDSIARVPSSSRQVLESASTGSCWAFQGLEVETCEYYQCGDAALCSDPNCKEIATRWISTSAEAVVVGTCKQPV